MALTIKGKATWLLTGAASHAAYLAEQAAEAEQDAEYAAACASYVQTTLDFILAEMRRIEAQLSLLALPMIAETPEARALVRVMEEWVWAGKKMLAHLSALKH